VGKNLEAYHRPAKCSCNFGERSRPNAARLFVDFLMSEAGQKLLYDGGQIPLRSRVVPASSPLAVEHLELHPVSGQVMEHFEQYKKEFNEVLGVRQ
jgi:ABC-type Fe3+ transport system substrate-binding protein